MTITYSHFANSGPVNPHLYSPNQMFAQEMIFEPLVRLGDAGTVQPCLAESWQISEDGRTYLFSLRKDVMFSDGQPFDAKAVEMNFAAIMANARRHQWLGLTEKIDSFAAEDRYLFRLTLKSPYHPTLEDLSLPRPFRFLSPAAFGHDGQTRNGIKTPTGTGPWKLAEQILGERDVFVRNDSYWGKRPLPSGVTVKVIPDPVSRALALRTGEVDLIYGQGQIDFDTFNAMRNDPAYVTALSNPVGTTAVAIHCGRGPTRDPAVRKALQHLVDKAAICRAVFLDTQPMADTLFHPDVPYCDVGLKPYAYDPALAASLLDGAGWTRGEDGGVRSRDGEPLIIDFCFVGNDSAHKAIGEVLQGQFAAHGVRLNLVGEEEDSFYRRQRDGSFGMILNPTWGPPFEPHAMLASMRLPSHADYQAQLALPMKEEIDRNISRALDSMDETERRELYRQVLTTLHDQAVYLPICHQVLVAAYRQDGIKGFRFGAGRSKIPFEEYGK